MQEIFRWGYTFTTAVSAPPEESDSVPSTSSEDSQAQSQEYEEDGEIVTSPKDGDLWSELSSGDDDDNGGQASTEWDEGDKVEPEVDEDSGEGSPEHDDPTVYGGQDSDTIGDDVATVTGEEGEGEGEDSQSDEDEEEDEGENEEVEEQPTAGAPASGHTLELLEEESTEEDGEGSE